MPVAIAFGQQDFKGCARILHKGRLICLFYYVPAGIIVLLSSRIFSAIGVNRTVIHHAYIYVLLDYIAVGFHT